ncbi:ABC transporter ATP-binding protein [Marisediminicola senii]|uniref:ABC transporter ATP-binding protein n=1 Tax=Marisediminicola senii TaxID=2711233 RepID=UPI0013EBE77C|nr:ABC transporter ATP-binding protein [Marisediminicola senii]
MTPDGTSHDLRADGLALAYDGRRVVEGLDLAVPNGQVTVIVGPNACGKSTLLRSFARLLRPDAGIVTLDGTDVHRLPTRRLAMVVGLLPQQPIAPEGITVGDLVGRGRFPRQGLFRQWSAEDEAAVASALRSTDTLHLAARPVDELSGGQRQRVWIAMALAQETDILLLDEPTTFLDVTHQIEVLDLLHELNRERGVTIVMVLHDLNLAARYADHLVVMANGRIVVEGAPAAVITREVIAEAFGLEALVAPDPVSGSPMVVPMGRFHSLRTEASAASAVSVRPHVEG